MASEELSFESVNGWTDVQKVITTAHPEHSSGMLKIEFKLAAIGFPIKTILTIFDLLVSLMLPTKFQVNWPFVSEEAKKQIFKMATLLDF